GGPGGGAGGRGGGGGGGRRRGPPHVPGSDRPSLWDAPILLPLQSQRGWRGGGGQGEAPGAHFTWYISPSKKTRASPSSMASPHAGQVRSSSMCPVYRRGEARPSAASGGRSEERRVGKGCVAGWAACQVRQNMTQGRGV